MRCLVVLWHRCGGGVERHGTAPLVGCTGKTMRGPLGVPKAEARSKAWTIALALASPGTCTCAWRSCNPLRQPIAVVGGTESLFVNHILWAMSLDHSVRRAARDIIGTAMRRWPALLPSDTSHAPPPLPPNACVTCRRVAAPSQGPGQSPVLLFRVQRQVTAPRPSADSHARQGDRLDRRPAPPSTTPSNRPQEDSAAIAHHRPHHLLGTITARAPPVAATLRAEPHYALSHTTR